MIQLKKFRILLKLVHNALNLMVPGVCGVRHRELQKETISHIQIDGCLGHK
jgi:hypothetical protein